MRTAAKQSNTNPSSRHGPSADDVYDRIVTAVFEHRLAPGTKLGEDKLAAIFGVSRSRIRLALNRLAHEQIVRLEPNRGAYVASPSPTEAREIFEARRLIEPGVVRRLVEVVDAKGIARLRALVRAEADARNRNDRRTIIRMSGEFHVVLAELAGNAVLARTIRELASLTCLIIFLYDSPAVPSCHGDEHATITAAIAGKDAAKAVKLMIDHLHHVESSLALNVEKVVSDDLERVFGS
jgi:DNA-binding GntR family transcriptional regulator